MTKNVQIPFLAISEREMRRTSEKNVLERQSEGVAGAK